MDALNGDDQPSLVVNLVVKNLGTAPYLATLEAMKAFTLQRALDEPDQCWIVSHPPVFTQGVAGKPEHVLQATSIPVVQSDRGGQITYHGPGQLVLYWLCNLQRLAIGPKALVHKLESGTINALNRYAIESHRVDDAPGLYVDGAKIASIGLRVKRGCSYHGISVNLDMDLTPFDSINACGYPGLSVTQVVDQLQCPAQRETLESSTLSRELIESIGDELGYSHTLIRWELATNQPIPDNELTDYEPFKEKPS